jgi:glutamine amidotransferase
VQQTNCHPFRYDRWLFVHNGFLNGFGDLHRELLLAVDPSLFNGIEGSTDSEVLFHLALSMGREDDPLGAMERAVGLVEARAAERGIADPVQMTVGIADGERVWAVRYSTQRDSRTLFVSNDIDALRKLHPGNPHLQHLTEGDRAIVSEPLGDLPGVWLEVPESTALVIEDGALTKRDFSPRAG